MVQAHRVNHCFDAPGDGEAEDGCVEMKTGMQGTLYFPLYFTENGDPLF